MSVQVEALSKVYRIPVKAPGLWGSLRALVRRRHKDVHAVSGVSFSIRPGEIVGFLGPNGAGKTTTLKMLSGLLHPSSGRARVLGHEPWRREREFQKRLTLVMGQRTQLWWELPALETFRLNKEIYELSEKAFSESLGELSAMLELSDCLHVPVKKLSLGQRMKTELALCLLHRPELLLLDEPTLGLDVVMQKKVRRFLGDYAKGRGATVLLTSHNMDDVLELCPRVLIIDHGRLIYDGTLKGVVEAFAPHKLVRLDLSKPVEASALSRFGRLTSHDGESATLEIPRAEVSRRAAALLADLPVADLTIEEMPIDEIVREIFVRGAAPGSQAPSP